TSDAELSLLEGDEEEVPRPPEAERLRLDLGGVEAGPGAHGLHEVAGEVADRDEAIVHAQERVAARRIDQAHALEVAEMEDERDLRARRCPGGELLQRLERADLDLAGHEDRRHLA